MIKFKFGYLTRDKFQITTPIRTYDYVSYFLNLFNAATEDRTRSSTDALEPDCRSTVRNFQDTPYSPCTESCNPSADDEVVADDTGADASGLVNERTSERGSLGNQWHGRVLETV